MFRETDPRSMYPLSRINISCRRHSSSLFFSEKIRLDISLELSADDSRQLSVLCVCMCVSVLPEK